MATYGSLLYVIFRVPHGSRTYPLCLVSDNPTARPAKAFICLNGEAARARGIDGHLPKGRPRTLWMVAGCSIDVNTTQPAMGWVR
jgi:hypothetical protein